MLGHLAGDLLLKVFGELLRLLDEKLGDLDLWWEQRFGRSLSGRLNKLEIQTLFHGNTKDQHQI